jgi:hypothetical protein
MADRFSAFVDELEKSFGTVVKTKALYGESSHWVTMGEVEFYKVALEENVITVNYEISGRFVGLYYLSTKKVYLGI